MKRIAAYLSLIIFLLSCVVYSESGINLPAPKRITLDNGLTVLYLNDNELPIVSFRLFIKGAGTAFEPSNLEGISDITGELLLKGTEKMTAEDIAEEIDFMGASLDVSSTEEYVAFDGNCLSEHFPKLIKLTAEVITRPAFKKDEFDKEITQRLDRIKSVKDNPYWAVQYYFRHAYFGDHPMSHISLGTDSSLKEVSLENVRRYYWKHYRPDMAILSVVGDIDESDLRNLLESTFSKWKKPVEEKPTLDLPELLTIEDKKLLLINKPDATQAYFVIGSPGIPVGDKLTPQMEVIQTLFGGRFTSWLNTELRIKRGLTYGARCSFETWKAGGIFYAYSFTQNKNIATMLDIVIDLLKQAHGAGFSKEEIISARNYINGQFPPTLERLLSKATAYTYLEFYNLGFDYYGKLLNDISAVQQNDANNAVKRLLPENEYVLVIIGKAEEIRPLLKKYGEFEVRSIAEPGF